MLTQLAAQTAYNNAKANYNRTNTLCQADAETRLKNAKVSFAAASENTSITNAIINPDNIASAKSQMDSAKAGLYLAKHALDNATITAPIAGKISAKNISVGELSPTQTPSIVLENPNSVNVLIKITETNINNVSIGMPANISIPSTGLAYDGTISTISPSADQKIGMYDVKVTVNTCNDNLKLGMVANVTLVNPNEDNIVLVPKESVFNEDNASYVYVINGDKLAKHTVTVGNPKNQYIEIKDGISEDD